MAGSDPVCAAALLALTVLVATGTMQLWMLLAAAATVGVAELIFGTSTYALAPTLVPTPELTRANGYLSVAGRTGSGVIGPALGGIAFGAAPCIPFAVNSVTYLMSSATVGSFVRRGILNSWCQLHSSRTLRRSGDFSVSSYRQLPGEQSARWEQSADLISREHIHIANDDSELRAGAASTRMPGSHSCYHYP